MKTLLLLVAAIWKFSFANPCLQYAQIIHGDPHLLNHVNSKALNKTLIGREGTISCNVGEECVSDAMEFTSVNGTKIGLVLSKCERRSTKRFLKHECFYSDSYTYAVDPTVLSVTAYRCLPGRQLSTDNLRRQYIWSFPDVQNKCSVLYGQGWTTFQRNGTDMCWKMDLHDQCRTYDQVRAECYSQKAHVASIRSTTEAKMMGDLLKGESIKRNAPTDYYVFIVARRVDPKKNVFMWESDGQPIPNNLKWLPGNPENYAGNEDCLLVSANHKNAREFMKSGDINCKCEASAYQTVGGLCEKPL